MRDLIDIVNQSPKGEGMAFMRLLEARTPDYKHMFVEVEHLARDFGLNDKVKDIKGALETCSKMGRKDREIWAARILRMAIVHDMKFMDRMEVGNDPLYGERINKMYDQYKWEHTKTFGNILSPTQLYAKSFKLIIDRDWKHFSGIPYSKIQDYVFGKKDVIGTFDDLRALEQEWKERVKGTTTIQEGDEIILTLPNGFIWVRLSRGVCPEEAKAMGHCGNAGGDLDNERILSLRRKKETINGLTYYDVFLTFILDENGKLGEMKGRGNEKPNKRYFPQIIALLKSPIIKSIDGGGYLPQNNFNVEDLPEEDQDDLFTLKPALATLNWKYNKQGLTEEIEQTVYKKLSKSIYGYRLEWTKVDEPRWRNGSYGFMMWPRVMHFLYDVMDQYDRNALMKVINAARNGNSNGHHSIPRRHLETIWNKLPADVRTRAVDLLNEKGRGAKENVFSSLFRTDDEFEEGVVALLQEATMNAINHTKVVLAKAMVNDAIKNAKPRHANIPVSLKYHLDESDKIDWEKDITIMMTEKQVCEFAGNVEEYVEEFGMKGVANDFIARFNMDVSEFDNDQIEPNIAIGVDKFTQYLRMYRHR